MKDTRKPFYIVLSILLAVGCGPERRSKEAARTVQSVEVYSVRLDTVVRTAQLLGVLQGEEQAMAMPKFAGRVTEIVRPEGSPVREGDPILYVLNDVPGMDYKPGPVRAPVTGVIGKVYVEVGQSVSPATPVAAVSRFSERVKVKAAVSDGDLRYVRVGSQARISVAAVPETGFAGRVTQASSIVDPLSRAATVEVTIANRDGKLVPGMSASIRLTLERREGVPAIPLSALFTDGKNRVMVIKDGTAHLREIVTGLVGDELVEVRAGLNVGETIATTGKERIKDGETVQEVRSEK